MVDKLNPLVGSVVRHTIINYHVEPIPLGAHIDEEGYRVSYMYRAGYSGTCTVHSVNTSNTGSPTCTGPDTRVPVQYIV